jgi:hypothetical protein
MIRLPVASLIAAILGIAAASAEAQTRCPELAVLQKSFKELTRNAYVWVDDIESGFPSGYKPFELVVVVGGAYPPFGTREGKLERGSFDRLMKTARLADRKSLTVTAAGIARGAEVVFQSNQTKYRLRVVKVDPAYVGNDKVTLQLCQG